MTVLSEALHAGAYIVSEANGHRSREEVFIEASATVVAGQVLGRTVTESSPGAPRATATANAANTGNMTIALDATEPVQPAGQDGVYQAICVTAGAAGEWQVYDPKGIEIGRVANGATFNNQVKFVITDGSAHAAIGDSFQIAVGIEAESAVATAQLGMVGGGAIILDATNPVNFATALPGIYPAVLTTAAGGGGTWTVSDPQGNVLGTVAVGATFNNEVKFVITATGADFALGDTWLIAVNINEVERVLYAPLNLSATDGTQNAAAIAMYPIVTGSSPAPLTAHTNDCEVRLADLTWPATMTAAQQAAAIEQLRQLKIKVR